MLNSDTCFKNHVLPACQLGENTVNTTRPSIIPVYSLTLYFIYLSYHTLVFQKHLNVTFCLWPQQVHLCPVIWFVKFTSTQHGSMLLTASWAISYLWCYTSHSEKLTSHSHYTFALLDCLFIELSTIYISFTLYCYIVYCLFIKIVSVVPCTLSNAVTDICALSYLWWNTNHYGRLTSHSHHIITLLCCLFTTSLLSLMQFAQCFKCFLCNTILTM